MKARYFVILLLLLVHVGYSATTLKSLALSATITGGTTVCQNGVQPLVTFTGNGGTAPYTFIYKINGEANQTAISGTNTFATANAPTNVIGVFNYTLISIQDSSSSQNLTLNPVVVNVIAPFTVTAGSNILVCKGNAINLTSSVSGNGTNTVSYSWSGPNGYNSNQQNPTISASTAAMSGNYVVTASAGSCQFQDVTNITVLDPKIASSQLQNYDGTEWLVKCTEPGSTSGIVFLSNGLANNLQSNVTSYTINWGVSGVPDFTSTSSNWNTNNSYNVGLYTITITITTNLNCTISRTYTVFVGNQPASPQIQLPANAQGCTPFTLVFPITGVSGNVPGTTYKIIFSDDINNPLIYNQFNIPTSITKTFNTSSCNSIFTNGNNTENNGFGVSIQAVNPCGSASSSSGPIRTSSAPTSIFTVPSKGCINQTINTNNQSISGSSVSSSQCNPAGGRYWEISPETGWTLNSSSTLGNNGGFPNDFQGWNNGTLNLGIVFNTLGQYTIKLIQRNGCSQTSIDTQTICIEPPLTPLFTVNTNAGCAPLAVTATNTTNLGNQCETPTYLWEVSYAPGFCGTSAPAIANQTTANATFNFTEAGTYTISFKTTNSCGTTTTTKTVEVRKPPVISINPITNTCVNSSITPVAVIPTCATSSGTVTYIWSFSGGNPATATTANPGTISYAASGLYTISLVVTNSCGASNTATQTFTVNPTPTMTNTVLAQTICSGAASTPIVLTATPSGTTFSWTATATAGISGFTVSGATATIPAQTIITSNASAGIVTYTITPTIGICIGMPMIYMITVNPAPIISTQPIPSTICLNGTATPLNVVVNSSLGVPTYQWYSSLTNVNTGGTLIVGATSATFIPPTNVVEDVYYYCIISLPSGGCSSLTSTVALVKVVALPTITTQPMATQNICVETAIVSPLSVIATGGTGIVSYQWFSNASNATTGGIVIPGATASSYAPPLFTVFGTFYYYVTVTYSGNNCGNLTSQIAVVTVFADPTTTQPLVSQNLCQGASPTTLEVTATGGNGTFSYQWFSNLTNNTTSGTLLSGATNTTYVPITTAVGTVYYYCIITQSTLGCGVTSATAAVIVNQSPSVSIQPTSATACLGGNPATLSVLITDGAGTPTYQWFSNTINSTTSGTLLTGQTNATFTPPASAIATIFYYCSVTFSAIIGSCATVQTNTSEVTITAAATIDQNPLITQSLCVGVTIPNALTVSFNGGTGTPSYQWFSSISNQNTGGTLITGATTSTYIPPVFSTAGTFYFYVAITFSGSGCGALTSNTAQIIVINDPVITAQPLAQQTLCQNAAPASLASTASGGIGNTYSYQWYSIPTNTTIGGTLISGATTNTFLPQTDVVGTIFYYCIVSQEIGSGCNVTSNTAAVIINPAPAINAQPQGNSWCVNQSATPLTVTFTNGTGTPTYQWFSNTNNSNSAGNLIAGQTTSSFTPSTAVAGNIYYYCVITFSELVGGCEIVTSATAIITVNPFAIIASESDTICSNSAFLITPLNGNGNVIPIGTTYTWSQPTVIPAGALTGFSAQAIPQTEISQTLLSTTTNPATITYTVTPTSGICVGAHFSVTITVNPAINPNVTVTNNICFGVNNASIATNITGGIPPYVITWTGPNGFSSAATTISNIEPGTYAITIDDAGNCPFTNSFTITQPDDLSIITNSQTNSTCFESNDGTIDLSITGGTGDYTYSWTKDNVLFASTQDLSNLTPGVYTVTVTDENNCDPKTQTFTITEPPLLVVSLLNQTNINCFGASTGAININVVGGTVATNYNFSWTGSNGFTSSNQNLTAVIAGTYNLIVTDDNGCQKTLAVTLTQSTEIIISYTTTLITCYGANDASFSATIAGGNAPYTFTWNNLSTALNQNNLSAGDYIITIIDNLGCIKLATITIPEAPIFTVNPVVQNVSCFGANNGSINLNLIGGIAPVTLTWSDGSTAGLTRNNLAPGTYTATITDGKPCVIIRTFIIVQPQPLVISANLTNPTNCTNPNSGAINLIVSGGTPPFTYSWSNSSTTEDLNDLVAGNYSVIVIDAKGCSISRQYSLVRPEPIVIAVTTQTDFDCTTREVTQNFNAQASGGVPPFTYQWSSGTISGSNNQSMTTETNGTVLLTVFDSLGCSQNYIVTVDNPVIGEASFETISTSYTSFGFYSINDPIQFTSIITGDYESLFWDFGDGTFSSDLNPTHIYTIPKDYVVTQTVTYPFGCVYRYVITLSVEKGYILVMPTGFTPNNDNLNENFRPITKNLKNIVMDIFDSWGSIIYSEKGDVIKGWDGKIKGFNAENGNYYSKISAETFYGTTVYENQTFVVIK